MLNKIDKINWQSSFELESISEDAINRRNELIEKYNSLPEESKLKKLLGEYIYLINPKSIGEVIGVNLGIPFKENLTREDEDRLIYLGILIDKYSRIINKIIL